MLFCCILYCFVAKAFIYAVLSQTRFVVIYALLHGENLSKNCARGEKMTNIRYELAINDRHKNKTPGTYMYMEQ